MQSLVGIIRTQSELEEAVRRIGGLRARAARAGAKGGRRYNPAWNLALDLRSLLTVAEVVARAAAMRTESRGGHTRDDFPKADPAWGTRNVVVRKRDGVIELGAEPLAEPPTELRALIGEAPHPSEQPQIEHTAPARVG
jgi:succinate dehydrogenase / fumarate reductase flavoprotein subunit